MAERGPNARATIVESMRVGQNVNERDPEKVRARDAQLIAMQAESQHKGREKRLIAFRVPGFAAGFIAEGAPAAGAAFPQMRVKRYGTEGHFDDIVGRRFTILARRGDPETALSAEFRAYWQSLGGVSFSLAGPGALIDIEGHYERLFDEYGCDVIVKRPDHYIFGACRSMAELPALIADLRAQLRRGATP
jgi:hypothetical protein